MIMSPTSSTWNKTVAEGTEGGRMEGEENKANGSGNERGNMNRIGLPSKITAPQDAHRRLVLQVYLGSNTLEFSAICR